MGIKVITGDGAYGEPQGRDSQNITVIGQDDVIPTGKDVATEARYAPYINMVTLTWWQYDVATRGFVDTHVQATGLKGDKGDTGNTGPAPTRGTDYWTAQDVQAVTDAAIEAVLAVYPAAEEDEF